MKIVLMVIALKMGYGATVTSQFVSETDCKLAKAFYEKEESFTFQSRVDCLPITELPK